MQMNILQDRNELHEHRKQNFVTYKVVGDK